MNGVIEADENTSLYDAIIVGAGISGIATAVNLAERGFFSLVLEAGCVPDIPDSAKDTQNYRQLMKPYTEVDELKWKYASIGSSYQWNRVRSAGGRAIIWGGWLVRPQSFSWSDAIAWNRPWPIEFEEFSKYLYMAERWLNARILPKTKNFEILNTKFGYELSPKCAALCDRLIRPFNPIDKLFTLGKMRRPRIKSGAVCLRVLIDHARCIGIEYLDTNTNRVKVMLSDTVVLSASTIETTRILLNSDLESHTESHINIGKGFMDHLSFGAAVLIEQTMESMKEANPELSCGAAFIARSKETSEHCVGGYTIELHGPMPVSNLIDDSAFHLLQINECDVNSYTCYLVFVIGEMAPRNENTVSLHRGEFDEYGRAVPKIKIDLSTEDLKMTREIEVRGLEVANALSEKFGGVVRKLNDPREFGVLGVSHEAGTCVMGRSSQSSVTDCTGRVHGIEGLYIADASVLPTSLDCPPTLALVGLSLNVAYNILKSKK